MMIGTHISTNTLNVFYGFENHLEPLYYLNLWSIIVGNKDYD